MRTLAIDWGEKRVGLALSDEGGRFATPYDVLTAGSSEQAIEVVCRIVQTERVERLLIGLPLNMDDSIGPAAQRTIQIARRLGERCGLTPVFVDERLSSFAAESELAERKRAGERLTHKKKKQRLDAAAAALLLREFLDGRLPAIQVKACERNFHHENGKKHDGGMPQ